MFKCFKATLAACAVVVDSRFNAQTIPAKETKAQNAKVVFFDDFREHL